MTNYYLDIETTGLKPDSSKITTIQYQELDSRTGESIGDLIILKSWDSSEKEIVEEFSKMFDRNNRWKFIAHGYNLKFEHDFLLEKSKEYNLENTIILLENPTIDLHPVGILMNAGNFKGSGLDKISGKGQDGMYALECYCEKRYDLLIKYIQDEAREYIKLYVWLLEKMPRLREYYYLDMKQNSKTKLK